MGQSVEGPRSWGAFHHSTHADTPRDDQRDPPPQKLTRSLLVERLISQSLLDPACDSQKPERQPDPCDVKAGAPCASGADRLGDLPHASSASAVLQSLQPAASWSAAPCADVGPLAEGVVQLADCVLERVRFRPYWTTGTSLLHLVLPLMDDSWSSIINSIIPARSPQAA